MPEQLILFDNLSSHVLIVDDTLRIRYFNPAYFDAYRWLFHRIGIPAEQILDYRFRSDVHATGGSRTINTFRKVLNTGQPIRNNYFLEEEYDFQGIADLFYLSLPSFTGIAVIQNELRTIELFARQLNDYRQLLEKLNQSTDRKETLPLYFRNITGVSPSFIRVLQQGALVASSSSSVCIFGESGTGKEAFASAIHYSSSCSDGPLIKVNCSAIPEPLLESELFGYEKGAFTDADPNGHIGKFELADNGTLFLDEIGELPLSMQAKLLRAIQEKEITRIGGRETIRLNFRLITATNKNLEQMVADGTFREDLYYRICIVPITLPPLRERRADIQLLAGEFLDEFTRSSPVWKKRRFSDEVLNAFYSYSWPGNIRELRNCVERMALFSTTEQIEMDVLPTNILSALNHYYAQSFTSRADRYNLKSLIEEVEESTIRSVLTKTGGNRTKAIQMLGISTRTFYTKLEKYKIR